jgi:hypothetical protein
MYLRRRRFTIVVFQILDIKSNYLPGIVQALYIYILAGNHVYVHFTLFFVVI